MQKFYYSVNNWLVDFPTGMLIHLINGEKKRLGEYQIKLLEALLENAGTVMSREELTTRVWERRVIGSNSLPNAIHALRSALEDDGKKQKIIKTLPKKGYILDTQYCAKVEREESAVAREAFDVNGIMTVEEEDEDVFLPEDDIDYVGDDADDDQESVELDTEEKCLQCEVKESSAEAPSSRSRLFLRCVGIVVSVLLGIGVVAVGSFVMRSYHLSMELSALNQKDFSNINIYEVHSKTNLDQNTNMYLFSRLNDSYITLNKELATRSVDMTVYYHYMRQTLNYTFTLKSRCDEKSTVLYVYNWHVDNVELNKTIVDNTMSTLNEMATCK